MKKREEIKMGLLLLAYFITLLSLALIIAFTISYSIAYAVLAVVFTAKDIYDRFKEKSQCNN